MAVKSGAVPDKGTLAVAKPTTSTWLPASKLLLGRLTKEKDGKKACLEKYVYPSNPI